MVFVIRIDAPDRCPDCTAIRFLCLSNGEKVTREQAHQRVLAGSLLRSGSEAGPPLAAATRGATLYVRTRPNDTPDDNLLQLPRGC